MITPDNVAPSSVDVDVDADIDTLFEHDPADSLLGTVFENKYYIEKRLGEGGIGVVYRATHIFMQRPVAIKFLRSDYLANNATIECFKQEALAAGRLQHPNATAVLDFGVTNDTFYLVMEYLEGCTLRD